MDSFAGEIALYANTTTGKLSGLKGDARSGSAASSRAEGEGDPAGGEDGHLDAGGSRGDGRGRRLSQNAAGKPRNPGKSEPVFLVGRLKFEEQGVKIHADEVFRMENVRERLAKSVHFHLLLDRMSPGTSTSCGRRSFATQGEEGVSPRDPPGGVRRGDLPADGFGVAPSWSWRGTFAAGSATTCCVSTDDPGIAQGARSSRLRAPEAGTRTGGGAPRRRGDGGASDLVLAAGAEVIASHVQSVDSENPARSWEGDLVRMKEEIERLGGTWSSSRTCSSRSSRRFSKRNRCKTLDRREVILDIFARRARTRRGSSRWSSPAVVPARSARRGRKELSRLGGGIGPGDRGEEARGGSPRIRTQIRQLERELTTVRRTRSLHYQRRGKSASGGRAGRVHQRG